MITHALWNLGIKGYSLTKQDISTPEEFIEHFRLVVGEDENNTAILSDDPSEWGFNVADVLAEAERLKAKEPADKIRAERDRLLNASDWTQVADAPVDQAAWATYRQALRDITAQEGFPEDINWPVAPE